MIGSFFSGFGSQNDDNPGKADTTITILSDAPDPSKVRQPVTITFKVTASSGTLSGEVTVTMAEDPNMHFKLPTRPTIG